MSCGFIDRKLFKTNKGFGCYKQCKQYDFLKFVLIDNDDYVMKA